MLKWGTMAKLKLKPLGSRLIVKPIEEDEVTKTGIILPDTADKEKPTRGKVIAIGPGKILENGQREVIDLKVGDKVLFEKYGSDEYKIGEEEFLVVFRRNPIKGVKNSMHKSNFSPVSGKNYKNSKRK